MWLEGDYLLFIIDTVKISHKFLPEFSGQRTSGQSILQYSKYMHLFISVIVKVIDNKRYTDKLENFLKPEYAPKAIACLNDMVTDALTHVPAALDCIFFMKENE